MSVTIPLKCQDGRMGLWDSILMEPSLMLPTADTAEKLEVF